MSDTDQPDWVKGIQNAAAELAKAMEQTGYILTAQGAMGWLYRGDLEKARETLANLPAEQLQAVSVTASALASLADEIAASRSS